MARYHVAKDGVVRVCRTKVGNECPLVGSRHFRNRDEVLFYELEVAQQLDGAKLAAVFEGEHSREVLQRYRDGAFTKGVALDQLQGFAASAGFRLKDQAGAIGALNKYFYVQNDSGIAGELAASFEPVDSAAENDEGHDHDFDWVCGTCGRPAFMHAGGGAEAGHVYDPVEGPGLIY